MTMFKRWFFFLLVNILVITTLSITWGVINLFYPLDQVLGGNGLLLAFAALFGMGGAFISLLLSKWMAKKFMGVRLVDSRGPHAALVRQVHQFARKAGLSKMPEVGVYDSPDPNAFATGPSRSNSLVAVSTGLLEKMSPEEVEGVLAHEVAHIANGDMVTMTLLQGVINTIALFLSRLIANAVARDREGNFSPIMYFVVSFVVQIALSILGSLVVNAFSRWREYRADSGGARLAGKSKMLAALTALQELVEGPRQELGSRSSEWEGVAALKISSRTRRVSLFATHPPLELRIRALQRAPIV